jgi:hypothetical protein
MIINAFSVSLVIISPPFKGSIPQQKQSFNFGGEQMPENIVNLLGKIESVKGQEYVKGLVDMANLLAPDEEAEEAKASKEEQKPIAK